MMMVDLEVGKGSKPSIWRNLESVAGGVGGRPTIASMIALATGLARHARGHAAEPDMTRCRPWLTNIASC